MDEAPPDPVIAGMIAQLAAVAVVRDSASRHPWIASHELLTRADRAIAEAGEAIGHLFPPREGKAHDVERARVKLARAQIAVAPIMWSLWQDGTGQVE